MDFGICPLSVVPIRTSSSHRSEMRSQLLFGELFEILENKGRQWLKIRCQWDNHVGWISMHQASFITPGEYEQYQLHFAYNLEVMQPIRGDDYFLPITLGAQLPNFDGIRFRIGLQHFTYSGQAIFPGDVQANPEFVLKMAKRFLHTPFLWGGRSPFGIDSDGFVQLVFKLIGQTLPREADEQVYLGEIVAFVALAQPGDIAFFEDRNGNINHCGIILTDQKIIHAYGKVRIDTLDHYGIYNEEYHRYTHNLRLIKRLLPTIDQPEQKEQVQEEQQVSRQVELF